MKPNQLLPSIIALVAPIFAPSSTYAVTYLSVDEAIKVIFPELALEHAELMLTKDQINLIEEKSEIEVNESKLNYWKSTDGHVVLIDKVIGKHEFITYAVGINPEGKVKQIEILEYLESHGEEVQEAWWREQFKEKNKTSDFVLNKDIMNISGATLSSKHVMEGVKRLLWTYEIAIKGNSL